MKVTVSVTLDDDTTVSRTVEISSGSNPTYWAQGFKTGVTCAEDSIEGMLLAEYGVGQHGQGIHIVTGRCKHGGDHSKCSA